MIIPNEGLEYRFWIICGENFVMETSEPFDCFYEATSNAHERLESLKKALSGWKLRGVLKKTEDKGYKTFEVLVRGERSPAIKLYIETLDLQAGQEAVKKHLGLTEWPARWAVCPIDREEFLAKAETWNLNPNQAQVSVISDAEFYLERGNVWDIELLVESLKESGTWEELFETKTKEVG